MKTVMLTVAALAAMLVQGCKTFEKTAGERLEASGVAVQVTTGNCGVKRYNFTFEGFKASFDEPADPKPGRQWMWCMKWPHAFAELTGQTDGVARGYYFVYLDDINWMNPAGLKVAKRFHDFLVRELGFSDKAFLIGMSWGGFYSTRYAAAYPEDVASIYLDAPLMNFEKFGIERWAAARAAWGEPENGSWEKDPRMPVNLADKIARADIPLLLLYGGVDTVVPPAVNCERFIAAYKASGGKNLQVIKRATFAHHPHGFCGASEAHKVVDFFEGKKIAQ